MDIKLVRDWAAGGFLPTFRRLFESAGWVEYQDRPENYGGIPWPSINTGLSPIQHDIHDYIRLQSGSYRLRMERADNVKGDPFWKWFAESGRRIVLADVPYAIPKEEHGGKQFWGWGSHGLEWKKSSIPTGLLSTLTHQFGEQPPVHYSNYCTETQSLQHLQKRSLTAIERRTNIFNSLVEGDDWDLFYGSYAEAHDPGHLMWHVEDESHPKHRAEQLGILGHALRDVYTAMDRAVGNLIKHKDETTTMVIFFSQGMGPNYHGGHLFSEFINRFNQRWAGKSLDSFREKNGSGSFGSWWKDTVGLVPDQWRMSVKDLLSLKVRSWIGMKRQQRSKQWSRMLAFPLPQVSFSALRVNLAGREPLGLIQPGEEYRHYIDAFTEELVQLKNGETGEPAVESIFRSDQRVDPLKMGSGPDLGVWWRKSCPIRTLQSPRLGTMSDEFTDAVTGGHVLRDMLMIFHPQVKVGRHVIPGMNSLDIAPTLCDIAGVRPMGELEGTSRFHNFVHNMD